MTPSKRLRMWKNRMQKPIPAAKFWSRVIKVVRGPKLQLMGVTQDAQTPTAGGNCGVDDAR